jgi:predicted nucleic acid-binding protein
MILVDTSVWIEHLRVGSDRLKTLLLDEQVLCHPFVVGELACGTLQKRSEILSMLKALPEAHLLEHEEVLSFLEARRLYGRGIGWVDAHLLLPRCSQGAPFGPSTSRSGEQRLP